MKEEAYVHTFLVLVYLLLPLHEAKIVDMTYVFGPEAIYPPKLVDNPFTFTEVAKGMTAGGFWLEMYKYCTFEHGGTHLDAPAHFAKGMIHMHEVPIEKLIGPGVIINVKKQALDNPDYQVTVEDILEWEREHGKIPKGAIVIMNSGWGLKQRTTSIIFGTDNLADNSTYHFPGVHHETATWLVQQRDINVIGVDTPSVDHGQTFREGSFRSHVIFNKHGKTILENAAHLDLVPEHGSMIYIGVLKLKNGSGAQARVFAVYGDDTTGSASNRFRLTAIFTTVLWSWLFAITVL